MIHAAPDASFVAPPVSPGLARSVIDGRVGGTFWCAAPPRLSDLALLIDATSGVAAGAGLWRRALASGDAARVGVLVPPGRAGRGLAREVRRMGSPAIEAPVDPHALLAFVRVVHASELGAIGRLVLLAGGIARVGSAPDALAAAAPDDVLRQLAATPYADPFTGAAARVEDTIALLADWRRVLDANRGVAVATGMSLWKRRRIAGFLTDGRRAPPFRSAAGPAVRLAARAGGGVAVWSTRVPDGLVARATASGVSVVQVEDGFIRGVGLGSDLLPPCSIVVDTVGLYLDPARPSALERLLAETRFTPEQLARAARLREALVARGVSKYGAGGGAEMALSAGGRRLVLVPGQVAGDLSVRLGASVVRDNLALLRAVRAACPDACIIYRPHPDVEAGHRPGALADAAVLRIADRVLRGGSIARLIEQVDEVHTLTSLAGFEALLRGRRVVTYGQPFYAGWGLTVDAAPVARRTRVLTVDELVAGSLILFPRYLDPVTGWPCSPEILLDRISQGASLSGWGAGLLTRVRRVQGRLRREAAALGLHGKGEMHA